jgi:drug/metabolite transporter (DMT)-like permease
MAIPREHGLAAETKGPERDAAPVLAFALVAIVIFALTPVTTQIIVRQFDPLEAGLVRTAGAILVTLPLTLALRLRLPRDWIGWRLLLLNAAGTFTVFPVLFALGGQSTSAAHSALIMASTPIITGIVAAFVERRRPRGTWWFGSAVAFAGEAALILMRDPAGKSDVTIFGDLLVLGACLGSGAGYVAGARLSARIGAWQATFWAINLASLAQVPFIAWRWPQAHWSAIDAAGWASLFHLTYGVTVIALLMWVWALARGGIARIAVLQFAQPVIGLAFAALLLHEAITPSLLVAALFILAGVIIARRR